MRFAASAAGAWILGTGCVMQGGLEWVEDSGGSDLRVDSVSPDWGTPGGGTEVTLTGAGFEGEVTVAFGNAEVTPDEQSTDTLVVTTPAANVEATVDLTVHSDLGTITLDDAFTFSASGPPVDGDVGGLVQFTFSAYGCPSCLGYPQSHTYDVSAQVGFHDPVADSWVGWFPDMGTCVTDPTSTQPADTFWDVGEWVYLSSGSVSIPIQRERDGPESYLYQATGLSSDDYLKSTYYDLSVPDGGDIGPFEVDEALLTPQVIQTLTPESLLYNGNQAWSRVASRSEGLTVEWSPHGSEGSFVVQILVYSSNGQVNLGTVMCRDWDSGSLTIPASYLADYPLDALLVVYMNRYEIRTVDIEANGSTLEAVALMGAVGTATLGM